MVKGHSLLSPGVEGHKNNEGGSRVLSGGLESAQKPTGAVRWGLGGAGWTKELRGGRLQAKEEGAGTVQGGAPGEGRDTLGKARGPSAALRYTIALHSPVGASQQGYRRWGGGQTSHRAHVRVPWTGHAAPSNSSGHHRTRQQPTARWGHQGDQTASSKKLQGPSWTTPTQYFILSQRCPGPLQATGSGAGTHRPPRQEQEARPGPEPTRVLCTSAFSAGCRAGQPGPLWLALTIMLLITMTKPK